MLADLLCSIKNNIEPHPERQLSVILQRRKSNLRFGLGYTAQQKALWGKFKNRLSARVQTWQQALPAKRHFDDRHVWFTRDSFSWMNRTLLSVCKGVLISAVRRTTVRISKLTLLSQGIHRIWSVWVWSVFNLCFTDNIFSFQVFSSFIELASFHPTVSSPLIFGLYPAVPSRVALSRQC